MKRRFAASLLLLLAATAAFGHAGEVHTYMGTVTELHDDGSFLLKKTDGKEMHIQVSRTTAYVHADGHAAKAADVVVGKRVVVTIAKDGKTATKIKFAAKEAEKKSK